MKGGRDEKPDEEKSKEESEGRGGGSALSAVRLADGENGAGGLRAGKLLLPTEGGLGRIHPDEAD
jgi:hypothetical protein